MTAPSTTAPIAATFPTVGVADKGSLAVVWGDTLLLPGKGDPSCPVVGCWKEDAVGVACCESSKSDCMVLSLVSMAVPGAGTKGSLLASTIP